LPGQAANFEDDGCGLIIEYGKLGVWGLGVVVVSEAAPETNYACWHGGLAYNPAAVVDLVCSEICHVAVAGLPEPMPVVMEVAAS